MEFTQPCELPQRTYRCISNIVLELVDISWSRNGRLRQNWSSIFQELQDSPTNLGAIMDQY